MKKKTEFRLIRTRGNISFLGVEFSRPVLTMDLRCSGCGYEEKAQPQDEVALIEIAEATVLLRIGELSAEDYEKMIRNSPAKSVRALVALSESWKCSDCGEDNPLTLDSCWKCCSAKGTLSPNRPL